MNSGSSAFISSGGQSAEALAIISCHQTSRPLFHAMSPPVCLTTTHLPTVGHLAIASSVLTLSGILRPPRTPSSEVTTTVESQSWMRPASESGEKPPNTIEWMAPIREHASMATASSGIIGR